MMAVPVAPDSVDERKKQLGSRIRSLRETQGLSQRKFAIKIGTNQTHLWQVEKGATNAGIDLLCRIADGLGVTVKDLIDF